MPVTQHLHIGASIIDATAAWAAQPAPTPTPIPGPELNTEGISAFILTKIVPILFAVLGVFFLSRAGKGEMSRVLTSTSIAIIGLIFVVGAAALVVFGRSLVDLVLPTPPQP